MLTDEVEVDRFLTSESDSSAVAAFRPIASSDGETAATVGRYFVVRS